MPDSREQILEQIELHRQAIARLERDLAANGDPSPAHVRAAPWPPNGFYLTFYVVAGGILGIIGSLVSFLGHVFGSLLIEQDPYYLLRVYGTVFLGQEALATQDLNFFMLVAIVHFSVGACAGAVFHVVVNYFGPYSVPRIIGTGLAYGLLMWVVNFYLVLTWLEPALVGQAFVLELMPAWVAALTHIVYGLTLGLLEPLGRFEPYQPAEAA